MHVALLKLTTSYSVPPAVGVSSDPAQPATVRISLRRANAPEPYPVVSFIFAQSLALNALGFGCRLVLKGRPGQLFSINVFSERETHSLYSPNPVCGQEKWMNLA
jgi:hypothetical protein